MLQALLSEQETLAREPDSPQAVHSLQAVERIASVLQGEFLPYLDRAVAPLLAPLVVDAAKIVASDAASVSAKEGLEAAGMTAVEVHLRGIGEHIFGVNTSLMQAKEWACKTLFQYTEDLGDALAPHAPRALAAVLPNLWALNTAAVRAVSAAIVPRLVDMASARLASNSDSSRVAEAQSMLDASIDALCKCITALGEHATGAEELRPRCMAADSLSTLLANYCKNDDRSPLAVDAERELFAVRALRDAARSCMRGSDSQVKQSHHPLAGLGGPCGAEGEEEKEELEQELLTSAVDGIGWILKSKKEAFLPTFETELKPIIVPLLFALGGGTNLIDPSPPPSQASFALCMAIDVLEHCGPGGRESIFSVLLPAMLHACISEVPSTRQAGAYGLGVAGEYGGTEFNGSASKALHLLLQLVKAPSSDEDEVLMVTDNAISAALWLTFTRGPVLASELGDPGSPTYFGVLGMLLDKLPLANDICEGHDCHRRVIQMAATLDPRLVGEGDCRGFLVPELVAAIARTMVHQHEADQGGCDGGCGTMDTENKSCERQFIDGATRILAEQALSTLRAEFPAQVESAWRKLDEDEQRALHMPPNMS